MDDFLLDDVKALLDKDFGDDRILKQICRACENNEVISNYERNYVRKLAEKHLGKYTKPEKAPEEKPSVPDVVIPETVTQKSQMVQPEPRIIKSSSSKNSKMMLGIGGVALIIIIAAAVSFSGVSDVTPNSVTPTTSTPPAFSVKTDLTSYKTKDIISISGTSDTSDTVNLSIENKNNEIIWTEVVTLKTSGKFSTLTIAGGQGWESSGTFTIKADNGQETTSSTFSFTA